MMNSDRTRALLEWVNSIDGAPCAESLRQLSDGTCFIHILEQIVPAAFPTETDLSTNAARLNFLMKSLSEIYNARVDVRVNFKAIAGHADEFEISKVVMLMMYSAMVFSRNQQNFIQAALKLSQTTQVALKDMIESLMSTSDQADHNTIPPNFADILRQGVTKQDDSPCNPPERKINTCSLGLVYSNSPGTPLKILDSPQVVHRRVLRQKEQEIKSLESQLNTERHLKSELQADLLEKNKEIALHDEKMKEMTHLQQQLQQAQDDMDTMNTLKEETAKMEKELIRLRMQASSYHEVKERNSWLEKETSELYKQKDLLSEELKHTKNLLAEMQGNMEDMVRREAQVGGILEATKGELQRYQGLSAELQQQLTEVQKLYHESTMEQQLAMENLKNGQAMNTGESMTVFTEKRVAELEEALASCRTELEELQTLVKTKECQQLEAELEVKQTSKKLAELEEQYLIKCQEAEVKDRQACEFEEKYRITCQDLDTTKHQAVARLSQLQEEYQAKCCELMRVETEYSKMAEKHSSLCKVLEDVERQAQEKASALQAEIVGKSEEILKIRQQACDIEVQYRNKCKEMESVNEAYAERLAALEEQLFNRSQELENSEKQASVRMRQMVDQHKSTCDKYEAEILQLRNLLEQSSQALEVSKAKLLEMEIEANTKNSNQEAETTHLRNLLENKSKEALEIQNAADKNVLEKEEELMNLRSEAEEKFASLKEQLENKIQEVMDVKLLTEQTLQDAKDKYESQIKEETEFCQQKVKQLEEHIGTLKNTSDAQISQLQSDLDAKIIQLKNAEIQNNVKLAEIESSWQEKMDKMEKCYSESSSQLRAELQTSKDNYASAQSQVTQLRGILDTKTRVLKEAELKATEKVTLMEERFEGQLSKKEKEFEKLKEQNNQAAGQIRGLQASLEARGELVKKTELWANQSLCDMEKRYESQLRKEQNDHEQKVKELEEEIEMLKADYANAQDKLLNEGDAKVLEYEQELELYKQKNIVAENERVYLQGKCDNLEKKINAVMERDYELIADQKRQLSQAVATNKNLQSQLEQMGQEHSAIRERLSHQEQRYHAVAAENKKLLTASQRRMEDETASKKLAMQVESLEAQLEHAKRQLGEYAKSQVGEYQRNEEQSPVHVRHDMSMDCLDDSLEERQALSLDDLKTGSNNEDKHRNSTESSFVMGDHSFKHPMTLRSSHPAKRHSTMSSGFDPAQSSGVGFGAGSLFACEEEPVDLGFDWDSLSELQRRNTLCLPHLRSAYPLMQQPRDLSEDMMRSGKASASMIGDGLHSSVSGTNSRKRHSGDRASVEDMKKMKSSKPKTPVAPGRGRNTPRRKSKSPRASCRTPKISKNCQENKTPKLRRQTGAISFNIGFSPMKKAPERRRGKIKISKDDSVDARSTSQMRRKPLGNRN